jgi:hypothetical protein
VATAEVEAYTTQARWLLEWHNKRNDGFATRSVAILGFTGVILALLPRGFDLRSGLHVTAGIRWGLVATTALLLLTAVCCLFVLAPQKTSAPNIEQLRRQWRDYASGKTRNVAHGNIAESLLHGTQVTASSPIEQASAEASRRGRWFRFATLSLLAALASLATLIVQVFWQL